MKAYTWPVEIFGTHSKFSIMNYGHRSTKTDEDRRDLRTLYKLARSGKMTGINGTAIKLVRPFSANRISEPSLQLIAAARAPAPF